MLSQEDKRKVPSGVVANDDLMSSAKRSAMSRLMSAIKSDDASQALDALTDLLELCES